MFQLETFTDVLELVLATAVIGGVAGLIASLSRPPAGRPTGIFGIDNRVRFPRLFKNKSGDRTWGIDLGSFGPALIGSGGAAFVVFATGVDSEVVDGATVQAIDYVQLMILSIAGGAAGEIVFRSLRSGGKVSLDAVNEAIDDGARAAAEGETDPEKARKLRKQVRDAAMETINAKVGERELERN